MSIVISVTYVNKTENHIFGEEEAHETRFKTIPELLKHCEKEFGKFVSKMYVDGKKGEPKHIGWVFKNKEKYIDSNETFSREVHVAVHNKLPKVKRVEFFKDLSEL